MHRIQFCISKTHDTELKLLEEVEVILKEYFSNSIDTFDILSTS